jgi:hypothetical protein
VGFELCFLNGEIIFKGDSEGLCASLPLRQTLLFLVDIGGLGLILSTRNTVTILGDDFRTPKLPGRFATGLAFRAKG